MKLTAGQDWLLYEMRERGAIVVEQPQFHEPRHTVEWPKGESPAAPPWAKSSVVCGEVGVPLRLLESMKNLGFIGEKAHLRTRDGGVFGPKVYHYYPMTDAAKAVDLESIEIK